MELCARVEALLGMPRPYRRHAKMTTQSATIVQRLWNYCNVLRDDGVSYGDFI